MKEKRISSWIIEAANPTDIYLWCFCIVVMFLILAINLTIAIIK